MNMAVEFEEDGKSLTDYIAVLRRRKKQLFIPAIVTFVFIALVAVLWPATYKSSATILIEGQDIPKDLVRSTITSFASQQIQIITQRTMTIKNIMELVDKYKLYDEAELRRRTTTDIAKEFRNEGADLDLVSAEVVDPRSGRPMQATIAFTLSYSHGNPSKAQKVTNELVNLYLSENLRSRTEQSTNTSEFLKEESLSLAGVLEDYEGRLAVFKLENEGSLPELYQYNLGIIQRTEAQLLDSKARIKSLAQKKVELEAKLLQLSPYAPTILATGERVLSDYDRLKALETEYSSKAAVYNDQHPDVVRLAREIAGLKETLGVDIDPKDVAELQRAANDKLATLMDQYTEEHPKVLSQKRVVEQLLNKSGSDNDGGEISKKIEADNPAYVFIETQLKSNQLEMQLLEGKAAELSEKIAKYEGLILKGPQVEKEYRALERDYINAQAKYREIKAKLMEAELGQNLEEGRRGERFTLIQPPLLPQEPVSPNRAAIIIIGFILALGVGVATVVVLEMLDPGLRGEKQLTDVLGGSPLLSVPYLKTEREESKSNKQLYIIIGSVFIVGIVALIAFHFLVKPLDVTWYLMLRRLGIDY